MNISYTIQKPGGISTIHGSVNWVVIAIWFSQLRSLQSVKFSVIELQVLNSILHASIESLMDSTYDTNLPDFQSFLTLHFLPSIPTFEVLRIEIE